MSKPLAHGGRPQPAGQTSWANKVRVSDSSTRFTLEPLSRQPLGHRLVISEEMLLDNADQWNRCMVGFFPGFRMPYHAVNTIASRVWRQCGLENVATTSNGFMLFRFKTEIEMHAVLEKGPWMFGGKNIVLQQWHPRFQFDKNNISTLPVWVRLHGLPFPLWSKSGLSMAASMVGRPLSCDESTYTCTKLDYARVCVEVDASLPYVHEFEVDSPLTSEPITVKVDYEWKPSRCEKCHIFGHSCPIAPSPPMNKGKMPVTDPNPIPNLDLLKLHLQPSTSGLPIPTIPNTLATSSLITSPKPPLPDLSIPSLPPEPVSFAEPIVAPPLLELTIPSVIPEPVALAKPIVAPASFPHTNMPSHLPIPLPTSNDTVPTIEVSTNLNSQHLSVLDTTVCLESKMASLQSHSESSNAMETSTAETASIPFSESYDEAPNPSPKTIRKKKGGKKRKEARGLQWV